MDIFVELKAVISEFQAKMAEARGEMSKTESEGSSHFSKLGKIGGAAMAGIAGAAVAGAVIAIHSANELEDAHAKLLQAVKNTGGGYQGFAQDLKQADKDLEHLGFTNAETESALAAGTTATGSAAKAMDLLGTAANLAAFKHIDLSTAMTTVAKASEGNLRPLKQLGIDLPVVSSSAEKVVQAQTALAKAEENLKRVQEALHPSAAQIAADHLSAEKSALAFQTAENNVTLAHQAVQAILSKYPDAAKAASKGHQLLVDADAKLKLAEETAGIAAQNHGKILTNTGPQAQYQAAVQKVADAQAKLSAVQVSGTTILGALNARLQGQAAAAADTFSGKLQVLKAEGEDFAAKIGMALIPILEKLMTTVANVVGWFEKHRSAAVALGLVVGGMLVAAFVAWAASAAAAAIATIAATWPILAIIVAVGAVAAGIGYLATHWKQVWNDIKQVASEAWQWIQHNAVLIATVLTAGIGGAVVYLWEHWTAIWHGMETAVRDFVGFFTAIPGEIWNGVIMPIWNFFVTLPSSIVRLFEHLGPDILHAIESQIPGGGIAGKIFSAIGLASGGLVTSPTLAVIGEAGPELVIPLSTLRGAAIDASGITRGVSATAANKGAAPAAAGPGGDLVVNLFPSGPAFARVAGPVLRTWFEQSPGRNATRGRLT